MSASFSRPPIDFEAINRAAMAACPGLLLSWFSAGRVMGREFCVGNLRGDRGESLRINLDTGVWADFGDGAGPDHKGRDLIALYAARANLSQVDAARELSNALGLSGTSPAKVIPLSRPSTRKVTAEWAPILPAPADAPPPPAVHFRYGKPVHVAEVRGPNGDLLHYICRFEPEGERKQVWPLTYGTTTDKETGEIRDDWRWKAPHSPRPLYGLPEMAAAPDALVVVVEGEPKRDAGQRLLGEQAVVVSWPNGADGVGAADWPSLRGRRVVVWPDADEKGKAAASKVVEALNGIALSAAIVPLPDGKADGWDLADAEREGWNRQQVLDQIARAGGPQPKPLTEAEILAEIERLSRLSQIAYQTERKSAAKALGFDGVGSLDKLVDTAKRCRREEEARAREKEPAPATGEHRWPADFVMSDDGLFVQIDDRTPAAWVCARFEVLGEARDLSGEGWGKWLSWLDADGREHTHPVADRLLHVTNGELEATLANGGLRISPDPKLKGMLRKALAGVRSGNRVSLVSSTGWKTLPDGNRAYILADGTVIGKAGEKLVLHPKPENGHLIAGSAGTLEEWKTEVAAKAEGNTPATFCVSAAFVGPLMEMFDEVSGGFHLDGVSKAGKSLAARLGVSVGGLPFDTGAFRSWNSTVNAMETSAEASTDGLFVLDEIGQADPGKVTKAIYMIANETGKERMSDKAVARARRSWRTFIISTGEKDIATVAAEAGQKVPAGAEVRLPSIKTTTENTWPNLHGFSDIDALAGTLIPAMRRQHGTAARAFIERLTHEREVAPDDLFECLKIMRTRFFEGLPAGADPQVRDVARRFALVACAGELAVEWGVLPWKRGASECAAVEVLQRWLESRGGVGAIEVDQHVQAIRRFLLADGPSRFVCLQKNDGGSWQERNPDRLVLHRAGWRRPVEKDGRDEYLIPPETWREECAKLGVDPTEAARTLLAKGYLTPGDGKNLAATVRIPGIGKTRAYVVGPNLLGQEPDAQAEGEE